MLKFTEGFECSMNEVAESVADGELQERSGEKRSLQSERESGGGREERRHRESRLFEGAERSAEMETTHSRATLLGIYRNLLFSILNINIRFIIEL